MLFVLTGPESTGKTTLAGDLAHHFSAPLVAEAARVYLPESDAPVRYLPSDLLRIAERQAAAEARVALAELAVADTDQQVIYVWWQERYGAAPRVLGHRYAAQSPRHYLLCAPDLRWEADPLRENPSDRDRLFVAYRNDLESRGLSFDVISGSGEHRLQAALACVREQLPG